MIEIPDRALVAFANRLPPRSELAGILSASSAGTAWLGASARNAVELLQLGQGAWADLLRRADVPELPPGVQDASRELWDLAPSFAGLPPSQIGTRLAQVAASYAWRSLAAFGQTAPILGWVISAAKLAWQVGRAAWADRVSYDGPYVAPLEYDPDTDAAVIQQALDHLRGSQDWTWIFLPYQVGEIYSARIDVAPRQGVFGDVSGPNRAWAMQGDQVGWGAPPGAGVVWRAWVFDTDSPAERNEKPGVPIAHGDLGPRYDYSYRGAWSDYHPAVNQAAGLLWDRIRTASREAFQVDVTRIIAAWDEWAAPLHAHAAAGDAMTNRRARSVLREWSPVPRVEAERNLDAFVRRRCYELAERQLGLLDTLAVAYVSEKDAAFADPVLRERLAERRALLLEHPAVLKVSPAACPDPDYRKALVSAWTRHLPVADRGPASLPPLDPAADPDPLPLPPGTKRVPLPTLPTPPGAGGSTALALAAGAALLVL